MPDLQELEITRVLVEDLRADKSGTLIEQLATLIYTVFREPPWNEEPEKSRIHFGLGTALMRRNALLYIAKTKPLVKIAGFIMGLELLSTAEDYRDCTLSEISGAHALDFLAEGGKRVFYVSGLGVDPEFRRCHVAEKLSVALIDELRRQGFSYRLGRTDRSAKGMRSLYTKLGFQELPVQDTVYPERTYWLLRL
jgi:ribosomal protein S18 acetylase RimI-like enzyme